MEILGIGPTELLFIIIIAIIILGPRDMQKAGKTIGRWLNKLIRSEGWQIFQKTSSEMRNLPTRLMREANLEMQEAEKDIRKAMDMPKKPATSFSGQDPSIDPRAGLTPANEAESTTQSVPPVIHPTPEPNTDPDQHD